jgi:thiol:disulfide interchange protein
MKNYNLKLVIVIVFVLLLAGGGYLLLGKKGVEDGDINTTSGGEIVSDNNSTGNEQMANQESDYPTNYRDYSADELEKAKSEGKVVMLYFTANWCPTCKAQEPINVEAFKELENDEDIVIFKIHILDSETTDETEKLAREYGIRLQHTFVIINPDGEVVFTHTGPLVKEDLVKELLAVKKVE